MKPRRKSILAWHFVGATLRDGRPVPKDGEKLKFDGTPIMCERGLHASRHPFDALRYAPGSVLCRVRCGGTIIEDDDKLVCTERTILARKDAADALRYFARRQALSVIDSYPGEPADAVLDWLMGDDSARSAAESAAESAARSAAWSAAESAAESAAWSAARSAAESAAWSAAWSAARSAAESATREEWADLVEEAFR